MPHNVFVTFFIIWNVIIGCADSVDESRPPAERIAHETRPDRERPKDGEDYTQLRYQSPTAGIPVETFLVFNGKLTGRINAASLTLTFESNLLGATFECRLGGEQNFAACPGKNQFTFPILLHGKSYHLEARAVDESGKYDATPVVVRFVADRLNGDDVSIGTGRPLPPRPPVSVAMLPTPVTSGQPATESRQLLLGEEDVVVVPYHMLVASFSATKNLSGDITYFELMANTNCDASWERQVRHQDGIAYCEAFPTRERFLSHYARPKPFNHIYLDSPDPANRESLFAATFTDPFERDVGLDWVSYDSLCPSPRDFGAADHRRSFFGPAVDKNSQLFKWCLTEVPGTGWSWVAYFEGQINQPSGGRVLKAVYTLPTGAFGVSNSSQFVQRAQVFMRSVIVPTGQSRY